MQSIKDFLQTRVELSRDVFYRPSTDFAEKDYPDCSGKVFIVTGASSGIGVETARLLAGTGATVYITGRTPSRIEATLNKLRAEVPNAKINALQMDYKDLKTIKPAIDKFLAAESRLDGIIHNAGVEYNGPIKTDIGYTEVLVVNSFAPQLVQTLLDPILLKTAKSAPANSVRIVWLSSTAHNVAPAGGINWDDIDNPPNTYGFGVYGQTKAINIYQAVQWAKHHPDSGVVSVAVHPGFLTSDICRDRSWDPLYYFRRPPIYGGYQEVWPFLHESVTTADNGSYWIPIGTKGRIRPDIEVAANGESGKRLWDFIYDQIKPFI